ncbi:ABC transporter ATP-binding protein [Demequina pelophila]|uniref:ABC transporter ATP-binding protein n=1 Tax=Demequina pelophila TaxID=1638984 RepID=UPI000784D1CD|nr:ABC transporter ATP-binding protein [Demequina pelophila]
MTEMTFPQLFRRGLELSPEFRRGLGVTLALAAVAAAGRAAVPFLTQRITDFGLLAPDGVDVRFVVEHALMGSVVLVLAAIVAWRVRARMVTAAEAGLATLRIRAFGKVHELSVLTQNEEQRGRYVSRVTGDVETMRDLMQWTGAAMVISALESAVVFSVMLAYSWQLSLLVLLAFVPMVGSLLWIQPRVRKAFQGVRQRMADLLGRTSEQIVGVSTIRSYGVQERMRSRLRADIDGILAAEKKASVLASLNFSSTVVGQSLATGLALIGGTYLALDGRVSVGTVVAFAFLVHMFSGPLMWIIEMLAEMQRAIVGWRRVVELVDQEVTVADPAASGTPIPHGRGDLAVSGVRLTYPGGPEVLKGIDLDLPAGRRLALVGQTGSGKTSLARLLSRFFDPTDGTVRVGGVDLREVPMSSLRRSVAVVPQEGFLFDGTIVSNLSYALPDSSPEDLRARAGAAFESLGLDGWIDTLPEGLDTPVGPRGELLSAGERQLVSIARAYLRDPDLLILDEATSAVDPATEVRISRALESLMQGRTAVVIAHRLSTAERADVIGVMEQGELVEVGPHRELVEAGGIYARLHEAWVAQTR